MNKKITDSITVAVFGLFLFVISAVCIFKPDNQFSQSERRELAKKPDFSYQEIVSGDFANAFEPYCADQFPLREKFRSIKAFFATKILCRSENNGLYMASGHISKLDDKENDAMIDHASEKFKYIFETYISKENSNVYFTIIPDKNYFIASENGYPSLNYDSFIEKYKAKNSFMKYIEIRPLLSKDDYYKTDSHWKQDKITDIALLIGKKMGIDVSDNYNTNTLTNPFYGVYAGQYGMSVKPDTIKYLTNINLENCTVTYYDNNGKEYDGDMYDMDKAYGKDPYEMFLSGTQALVVIENPNAKTERELVMFRDSFGSSLAPLLSSGYKKITLVDIRYIKSVALGSFLNFEDSDVLFVYSTSILNNSMSLN